MTDTGLIEQVISPQDVIIQPLEKRLVGIEDVSAHLQKRSAFFLSRFADLSNGIKTSWSVISREEDGRIKKETPERIDRTSIFTAEDLCTVASFAIKEALEKTADDVAIDIVQVETDFHAEEWEKPTYQLNTWGHSLVKVTQKSTGAVRFFDPTYGQIDHRLVGGIVAMSEDELGKYYRNKSGTMHYVDVDHYQKDFMETAARLGWKEEDSKALVDTLL